MSIERFRFKANLLGGAMIPDKDGPYVLFIHHRDVVMQLESQLTIAKANQVSGCYEETFYPTYTQGAPTNELQSLVNAHELKGLVDTILRLRKELALYKNPIKPEVECAYMAYNPDICQKVATKNRGGYDLCETCYKKVVDANIKADQAARSFLRQAYKEVP